MIKLEGDIIDLSKELQGIAASVFEPGNLVWGANGLDQLTWFSLIEKGVCRPKDLGLNRLQPLWFISLSLLSKKPYPDNYDNSLDHGSKATSSCDSQNSINLAIVIDRRALLEAYRGQIYAEGDHFFDQWHRAFDYDVQDNSVYEIPLRPYDGPLPKPYEDEVRIYPVGDPELDEPIKGIKPCFWRGLVVHQKAFNYLQKWNIEQKASLEIPVFTPDGEFIARHI